MRTRAFKYLRLAVLAALMVNFTSCEIEVHDFFDSDDIGGTYYSRSSELCSRTWVNYYRDGNGNRCRQEWDFYMDRSGIDYIRVEYPDGHVETFEYKFFWSWDNYLQTSIRMSYGSSDVSYLDEVYLGANRLSGYLDGRNNFVEFQGVR